MARVDSVSVQAGIESEVVEVQRRSEYTRDPERRERILAVSATLLGASGFHGVSLAEIGRGAGITGPAIYRHFGSKSAILVALFDRAIDDLLDTSQVIISSVDTGAGKLERLLRTQVDFVVDQRPLAQVYYREVHSLPEGDRERLRRKQVSYLEGWVGVLIETRSDLDSEMARTVVRASVGAIQSTIFHGTTLASGLLKAHLERAAFAVLTS